MTDQEVFNTVYRHLLKQGKRSELELQPLRCAYRGSNNRKCAVGCLIPDELYDPKMEGLDAKDYIVRMTLEQLNININLAMDLQEIHDQVYPGYWDSTLAQLALSRGLKVPDKEHNASYSPPSSERH